MQPYLHVIPAFYLEEHIKCLVRFAISSIHANSLVLKKELFMVTLLHVFFVTDDYVTTLLYVFVLC
jgi:hypothetical protein